MPITSDQVIDIIDLAIRNLERATIMEKVINGINKDMKELRMEIKNQNEKVEYMIDDVIIRTNPGPGISTQDIQDLMYMKAKFEINRKRNASAARRMRGQREREKEKEFMEGIMKPKTTTKTTERVMSILAGRDDKEYFKQKGEERHPELGDCDGEPCRKCEEKKQTNTVFYDLNPDLPPPNPFTDDDGITYKPTKDENEEWRVKEKEEKEEGTVK
jgi:hypothetical protein